MKNLIVKLLIFAIAVLTLASCTQEAVAPSEFVVYKDPQCGCCGKWIEHMEQAGFDLQAKDIEDLSAIKREFGIQPSQQSCHTGVWKTGRMSYVFEGHIPADIIRKFMKAIPDGAKGLAVPGMPIGSPGMEYGDQHTPYEVLLLKSDGSTEVYARIE